MKLEEHVRNQLQPEESLLLMTETDLSADGAFGTQWLAITSDRLMVFPDGPNQNGPTFEIALKEIKNLQSTHLVGRIALEAETDERRIEVLRYTNSQSEKFSKIVKSLNDARKDEKPPEFTLEDAENRVCPNCGRLLPEKGSFCPACLKKTKVIARFWRYMKPHRKRALAVSACIMLGTVVELAPPYLVKILVDEVIMAKRGAGLLLLVVGGLVGVRVASMFVSILRGRLSAWLGARVIHEVRLDFYNSIQGLSLRRYDKTPTGSLMSRLTHDTTMLSFVFSDVGAVIIPAFLQLIGICVMLFWMDWKLAFLILIPTPGVVYVCRKFYRRLHGLYHRLWQRNARMSSRANDSISGIRVVKAFSQEAKEIARFGNRSHDCYHAVAEAEQMSSTAFPILAFITTFGTYLIWYFGGLGVLKGSLTFGTLMAFISYLAMFYGPLQMLTRFGDFMNRAFTAAQRLFEVMDADQKLYEDEDAQTLVEPIGEFKFENVHFGYVKDHQVLKGLEAEIHPGEMIGLVGRSGVGKTTLTNLICRFYDVDEGAIKLDGVDLRHIRLRDLRRHVGIVPQECFLFNESILENISYARPEATREDIIRAAIAANAHGFIMRLPDGYDTRVGERGARLSGGERQRIAIARAILHNPKILILDEATSSVDTETEELIQQALTRLVKNRTTFAIAHRLSTLRNANRLLVIDDGKVAEFGTHDELVAKEGIYYKLVEMQSKLSAIHVVDG